MRFEKAQDPVNTVRALVRAVEFLEELSPGARLVGGLADEKREIHPPREIELPLDWLERKLGRAIDAGEVRALLESLEFGVSQAGPGVLRVTVPSWRATKDITIKDDLVEEVGRMVGYDSITPKAPLVPAAVPPPNIDRQFQHEVRTLFADLGFTEVYNYSFLSEEALSAFGMDPAAHIRVANPIASDQALLRTSLLPGIWRNILENSKHREAFRIFELGLEIHRSAEGLPSEVPHLLAAIYDRHGDGAEGLFEIKRAAECLIPDLLTCQAEPRPFEHPARTADVLWKGQRAGRLFELHPSRLEFGRAAVLDLDLQIVQRLSTDERKYTPIRRYPSSAFDLSVIAPLREPAGKLQSLIAESAGSLMESVEYLRQYTGSQLDETRKSVSFRVTVSSPERTLSSEDVSDIRERIIAAMRQRGYELRV
jgi:phenylalanyl-tRNA synthetase beta chain